MRAFAARLRGVAVGAARWCIAVVLVQSAPALASEARLQISGGSECPTGEGVADELYEFVPADQLSDDVEIDVRDLGESFRVEVRKGGVEIGVRVHSDPERDCETRRRFAAVFVAMTLMPPELKKDPLSEQYHAPPSLPRPKLADKPAPRPPLARVELTAALELAPPWLEAPFVPSPGAELRVALGRGSVAGTLALGYAPATSFELGRVEGRVSRLPASAGVRLRSRSEAVELSFDLGVLVSLQRVEGTSLVFPERETAIEIGARSGLSLAYRTSFGVSPLFGVSASFVPAPHRIESLPRGEIGNMPYVWLGANLGLSLEL